MDYEWRLRLVMAQAGMFKATDLTPKLAAHGIVLSESQVWRLVTGKPERLNLRLLAASVRDLRVPARRPHRADRHAGGAQALEQGQGRSGARQGSRPEAGQAAPAGSVSDDHQQCAACGHVRRVYGRAPDGVLCVTCFRARQRCARCDGLGVGYRGLCWGCLLADRVDELRARAGPERGIRLAGLPGRVGGLAQSGVDAAVDAYAALSRWLRISSMGASSCRTRRSINGREMLGKGRRSPTCAPRWSRTERSRHAMRSWPRLTAGSGARSERCPTGRTARPVTAFSTWQVAPQARSHDRSTRRARHHPRRASMPAHRSHRRSR